MWAIPTGASSILKKKRRKNKNQVKSPSIWSRVPNSVRIRQSGRTGNRDMTNLGFKLCGRTYTRTDVYGNYDCAVSAQEYYMHGLMRIGKR